MTLVCVDQHLRVSTLSRLLRNFIDEVEHRAALWRVSLILCCLSSGEPVFCVNLKLSARCNGASWPNKKRTGAAASCRRRMNFACHHSRLIWFATKRAAHNVYYLSASAPNNQSERRVEHPRHAQASTYRQKTFHAPKWWCSPTETKEICFQFHKTMAEILILLFFSPGLFFIAVIWIHLSCSVCSQI